MKLNNVCVCVCGGGGAAVYYVKASVKYVCTFSLAGGKDLSQNIVVLSTALTEVVDASSL
jgi:hypothetical protein